MLLVLLRVMRTSCDARGLCFNSGFIEAEGRAVYPR